MSETNPGLLRRIVGGIWHGITRVRVALSNLLFLAVLVLLFFVFRPYAVAKLISYRR